MSGFRRTLAASILLSSMAWPALAQDTDWWPHRGMGWMMERWDGSENRPYGFGITLDRIDGRLAFLRTELKITAEQTAAWDELSETLRTTAASHNSRMSAMMDEISSGDFRRKPLPNRLKWHEEQMQARLKETTAIRQAVDKLYAMLTNEQKQTADDIVLPMMGYGHGRGMMFN